MQGHDNIYMACEGAFSSLPRAYFKVLHVYAILGIIINTMYHRLYTRVQVLLYEYTMWARHYPCHSTSPGGSAYCWYALIVFHFELCWGALSQFVLRVLAEICNFSNIYRQYTNSTLIIYEVYRTDPPHFRKPWPCLPTPCEYRQYSQRHTPTNLEYSLCQQY